MTDILAIIGVLSHLVQLKLHFFMYKVIYLLTNEGNLITSKLIELLPQLFIVLLLILDELVELVYFLIWCEHLLLLIIFLLAEI